MASRLFPLPLDEEEVRRLCGAAAFARADAWQRDGHVTEAVVALGTLTGEVRGTWQRVDAPTVTAPDGKLASTCSCQQPTLCVHAAALLLHWLRQPSAFQQQEARAAPARPGSARRSVPDFGFADEEELDDEELALERSAERTPADEVATLLELFSMPELREVARRRDVRPTARNKAELTRQLAEAIATPESVDAALAKLSGDEMLTLQIIGLLGPELADEEAITAAFRALSGTTTAPPVGNLLELALVGAMQYVGVPATTVAVMGAVSQRLGLLPMLARPAAGSQPAEPPDDRGLDLVQTLVVLVHEAQTRSIPPRPDRPTSSTDPRYVPSYWAVVEPPTAGGVRPAASPYREARLAPIVPMLGREERERLARETGRSPGFVTLALHVGLTLGIIDVTDRLMAEPERLLHLCTLAPPVRRQIVVATLAVPHYLGELRRLLGEGSSLELHAYLGYFGQSSPLLGQAAELRQLLLRAVGKLPPGVWYDYRAFRESLRRWVPFGAPALSFGHVGGGGRALWRITDHSHPDQELDLTAPAGWERVYGQFIDDVFTGVIRWIGLVDLIGDSDGTRAFRVRPVEAASAAGAKRLVLGDDLTIHVPAGMPATAIYALLTRGGELTAASPEGLRYRLAPERVRQLFVEGVSGPMLVQMLEAQSGQPLPTTMRAAIERWWTGYGRLRLYDDLTLIELADDYLLPELLRTTSLPKEAIHTFSPRLIAVEPQHVERLIAEFTRAGHPPSVAEGR